jgi:hypothetical protein
MRVVRLMNEDSFNYAAKTIDSDFRSGRITREEANRAIKKLKRSYSSGEVNRMIAKAADKSNTIRLIDA